jgi:hypothetical protein
MQQVEVDEDHVKQKLGNIQVRIFVHETSTSRVLEYPSSLNRLGGPFLTPGLQW